MIKGYSVTINSSGRHNSHIHYAIHNRVSEYIREKNSKNGRGKSTHLQTVASLSVTDGDTKEFSNNIN